MRVTLVSRHLPEPEGTAAGRLLLATADGLSALGHIVHVRSWRPEPPVGPLPDWCEWTPLADEPRWRTRARALVSPRRDSARLAVDDAADVYVADDPLSYGAVRRFDRRVLTLHYASRLDAAAVGWSAPTVQDWRADRAAVTDAPVVLTYSLRVARWAGRRAWPVPAAVPVPAQPLPAVSGPVAGLVADFRWAPNRVALDRLLSAWPAVRAAVPSGRLLLGGRGLDEVGGLAGVEVLGPVARSQDLLARVGVLAFPCPASSGPKVKVLEAAANGVPVVTTPYGAEGLRLAADCIHTPGLATFAPTLAAVMRDEAERHQRAALARAAVLAAHAPVPAARARLEVLAAAWPGSADVPTVATGPGERGERRDPQHEQR